MGARHSKGSTRAELHAVLPRSWSELELFYARFQQEAFRRRTSDPQSQFFLSFPVFRHVVAVVTNGNSGDVPDAQKERLLRVFAYLDRAHRQRIAAIDFFAGLSLVTKGKKAAKFEFLFSLLDNGGLKTLNACEVMMVLAAAARGLAMFKAIPSVEEESLRPLARRLLGEGQEVARSSLVEKALSDPEIVFFMNDLENESATTSDALLAQQSRLMKSVAANELQIGRVDSTRSVTLEAARRSTQPPQKSPRAVQPGRVLSADAMLRRLQALLQPPTMVIGAQDGATVPSHNPAVTKRINARSLSRLVQLISDRSLTLPDIDAERIVASMYSTDVGYVKSSEILRSMRPWILRATTTNPPVWQSLGQCASKWLSALESAWGRLTAPQIRSPLTSDQETKKASTHGGFGTEVNYSLKVHVKDKCVSPNTTDQSPENGRGSSRNDSDTALRIRVHLHHRDPHSQAYAPIEDGYDGEHAQAAIVLILRLRTNITDEEAIDIASAVEQLLADEVLRRHIEFAVERCEATVVGSQQERSSLDSVIPRCLRVSLLLKVDIFDMFELKSGCQLSNLIRSCFASFNFDTSLDEIIEGAISVVRMFPHLVKPDERERNLRSIFKRFDEDGDGLWSLQEFNTFQQAAKEDAFDDTAFMQCFGARREIAFDDFADCYRQCSAETFRKLIEKLGHGSPSSLLTGTGEVNMTVDDCQVALLESSFSPLRWGQAVFKQMTFVLRNLTDLSCDFHCQSITNLFQIVGVHSKWWRPLECATPIVEWFEHARDIMSPRHSDHERESICRSLLCSLEDELAKSPQQLEQEDQQGNLPQGTSARQALLLGKVRNAAVNLFASVDGIESLSLQGSKTNLVCELDNFDFVDLLRKAVQAPAS